MDINQADTLLQKIAKARMQEFTFTYNVHEEDSNYSSLDEWLDDSEELDELWFTFVDDKERQQCIEKNTIWIYSGPTKYSEYVSIAASELQLIFDYIKKGVKNGS